MISEGTLKDIDLSKKMGHITLHDIRTRVQVNRKRVCDTAL